MKNFTVIKEQRDFFRKNYYLECEGIFSYEEVNRIAKGVENVLSSCLAVNAKRKVSVDEEFMEGRDLWRKNPALKKILLHRNLAEIASELVEQRPLRFGYDMLFPAVKGQGKDLETYRTFLNQDINLKEMSSIQGVVCGAMIPISQSNSLSNDKTNSTLFSKTLGNVVFFSPELKLTLKDLLLMEEYCYLMVVYVNAKAVYYRQDMDPHLHDFRKLGYQFGDKLTDTMNPIVYM